MVFLATLFKLLGKCPKFPKQLFKYLFNFFAVTVILWLLAFAKAFLEPLATII